MKRSGRCFVCFETGHLAAKYSSNYKCHKCQGKHNFSICLKNERTSPTGSSDSNTSNLSKNSPNSNQTSGTGGHLDNYVALQTDSTALNVNSCKNKVVLLQTAKTCVSNLNETKQICIAYVVRFRESEKVFERKCERTFEFKKYWERKVVN